MLAGPVLPGRHRRVHHSRSVAVHLVNGDGADGRHLSQFHAVYHDGHPRQSRLRLVADECRLGRCWLHFCGSQPLLVLL